MGNILSEIQPESDDKKEALNYPNEEQDIGESREGYGVHTYSNGDRYEGNWLNDMKEGKGYFFYRDGSLYIGSWVKDKKDGQGIYFYKTGDRYDGEWANNVKEGSGIIYYADGTQFSGYFKNGKEHGVGRMKKKNGTLYQEIWEEGELVSRKIIEKSTNAQEEETKEVTAGIQEHSQQKLAPSRIMHLNVSEYIKESLLHKNIHEWKMSDVGDWLDRGGFSQYRKNFEDNHITGRNLFDLTEDDLNEEINIKDVNHRKIIMKDLKLLKRIYTKNPDESKYIRNKLLKFYEKSQLFINKSERENKKNPGVPVQVEGPLGSDQNSSSSNSSISRQASEYRTILDNYQQNEGDLLATIQRTLGQMVLIDYSEIEKGSKIGAGGYGTVYKGKWLGQDVAIKEFGKGKAQNPERLDAEFLKEVGMVSKLRHPNILLFMGVSINPKGKGLLLTEFLEGGSLFDHIHSESQEFDDNQMIDIALDIALGMNYLHGQKIFHCDLKSSNILLDERLNVKLGDFGLSKTKRQFYGKKNFKRVGTPHWMAPEIMREEEYDEYSDVYSYGMILWELIAKEVPYHKLKPNQIIGAVGYGDRRVSIPKKGNETIRVLMKKCLNKDRKNRPDFKQIVDFLKESDKHRRRIAMRELDSFFNSARTPVANE